MRLVCFAMSNYHMLISPQKNSLELRESLRGPNMLSLDEYEAFSRVRSFCKILSTLLLTLSQQCHDEHEEANREGLSDEEYSRLKKFRVSVAFSYFSMTNIFLGNFSGTP